MVATDEHVRLPSAHGASRRHAEVPARFASDESKIADSQLSLGRSPAEADPVEQLGILDDAVFEAIAGRSEALDGLKRLWPEMKANLGTTLVEESREQYVRVCAGRIAECG